VSKCEGWGRGTRCIDVDTGSGLRYTIVPDRGMDISLASFRGINLVFLSCNGETHPSYYESENLGWFHTFAGGLLPTLDPGESTVNDVEVEVKNIL